MSFGAPPPPSNTGFERAAGSRAESEAAARHYQRAHGDVLAPRSRMGRLTDRIRSALRRQRA